MDKKIISTLSIGVIIVFLGGVFFLAKNTEAPTKNENNTWSITEIEWQVMEKTKEETSNKQLGEEKREEETINLWQKYMEGKIGNLICTLERDEEGWHFKQIVYINGMRMSMNSIVTFQGKTSKSYMINDGEYTYIWWTTGPAFKMKNELPEDEEEAIMEEMQEDEQNQEIDMEAYLEQIPYNVCKEWTVDESVFELPEGTDFMNFDEMMLDPSQMFEEVEAVEWGSEMPERYEEDLKKIQDWLPEN